MAPTKHGARIASRRSLVAYTSIIPVHRLDNALDYTMDEEKCSPAPIEPSLEGVVDEALNQDKSEQDLFQSAIGCTLESAFADMCAVKKMWHKEKGVQGFIWCRASLPGRSRRSWPIRSAWSLRTSFSVENSK